MLRRVRTLPPPAILLVGLGCFVLYAYPGLMSIDSVDQLTEARAGFYTDSHPPAMAALWRLLDAIVAGPFLMMLLQGITVLAGTYLVLARALSPRKAAVAASVVLVFPPVLTTMAFVWKDSLMAGVLMLGIGLVLSPDRRVRVASLACFTLATAVKYNALAATLPVIVLVFEWAPSKRWLVRYALAAAVWLGVTLAAMGVNRALTDQPMYYWQAALAASDIVGVINYEDAMSDAELRQELEGTGLRVTRGIQAHARKLYATGQHLKIVIGRNRMWDLPTSGRAPAPVAQRDAIASAWWRLITDHPRAYLRHRMAAFLAVLGITYRFDDLPTAAYPGMLAKLDVSPARAGFQTRWWRFNNWYWQHTPLFWQWIYVIAALALLWPARRQRDVLALLASGLVAEASLFFLVSSPDYRYSHWTIVVTIVAAIMLTSRHRARRRNQKSEVGASDHGTPPSDLDTPRAGV